MCYPTRLILPRSSRPQYSFIDQPLWEDQQLDAEETKVRHGLLPARGAVFPDASAAHGSHFQIQKKNMHGVLISACLSSW